MSTDAFLDRLSRARTAARRLATATAGQKNAALSAIADAIDASIPSIVEANGRDLERGRESGLTEGLLDRLTLDETRLRALANAVREVIGLADPIGQVVR